MAVTFVAQGTNNSTSFPSTYSSSVDFGAGADNLIIGWVWTNGSGISTKVSTLTIGGQSATLGSEITRETVSGVPNTGIARKFKLVGSGLTGSQTVVATQVDGAGAPSTSGNVYVHYAIYSGVTSITAENATALQGGATQTTTVTSPSGELAVWDALTGLEIISGPTASMAGNSGTTARTTSIPTQGCMLMDKPGAGSTSLSSTITGAYTPYTLGVSYSLASGTSGTAPTISTQPTSQTVTEPTAATFSVAATGTGTLTYQWQRNPNGNTSFANISGATGSSYTTPATTVTGGSANNTDTYRVIVTGDTSPAATSNVVTLTVNSSTSAPSIVTQPSSQTVSATSTATFSVVATGTALTYQWQRNPGGNTAFANISGATLANYTTPATTVSGGTANNGDTYRVVVTGSISPAATSNVATLNVTSAPVDIPFTPRVPYIRG